MTRSLKIEAGQRFGRLLVVREADRVVFPSGQVKRTFVVLCDCGREFAVLLASLRSGNTISCGCYSREVTSALKPAVRHGMSHTRTHKSWLAMRERVSGKYEKDARNYQSRGITMCERWSVFENFLADMGERPAGTTLDRIDNDGNYEPGNCRWASDTVQGVNRRTTRFVILEGERMCLLHAASRLGFHYTTIIGHSERLGVSLQRAVDHYAAKPRRHGKVTTKKLVIVRGARLCLTDAASALGLHHDSIAQRARNTGISLQEAADHFAAKSRG